MSRTLHALLLSCLLAANPLTAQCRMALAIGLDVSSSVDADEHAAQLNGLSQALRDPQVQRLMIEGGDPVALMVYEWSGRGHQTVLVPWKLIIAPTILDIIAARLPGLPRSASGQPTALGSAMEAGAASFASGPVCATQVLDISADGQQNDGPRPRDVRPTLPPDLVINALVIASGERATLVPYFQAEVIHGPGAFVEVATDYTDYGRAMARKLLREMALTVSMLEEE
ncbi:MAG: DUF1194 domain-containing protein [Paracoccaceae bacterium]